jgi:hypothetical protein
MRGKQMALRNSILCKHSGLTFLFFIFASVLICIAAAGDVTNSISSWLKTGTIDWGIWGAATNELCAGVLLPPHTPNASATQEVVVYVLTSRTNEFWNFLAPPNGKFARLELQDSNGVVVPLIWWREKLAGESPQSIKRENLPVGNGRRGGMYLNLLGLTAGQPARFKEFKLQEVYQIKQEGDYTLTVCVAMYQFAPDRKSVFRIDLPCVTTKVHLMPSQQER